MLPIVVIISLLITVALWRLTVNIVRKERDSTQVTARGSRVRLASVLSVVVAAGSGLLLLTLRPDASSLGFQLIRALALLSVVLLLVGMRGEP
jgi:hypothetical protein